MVITDLKIKVTEQMMFDDKLSRFLITGELGIPFSATQKEPVTWKQYSDLEEPEFDLIEAYFLNKIPASI